MTKSIDLAEEVRQTHLLAVTQIYLAGLELGLSRPIARAWSKGAYMTAQALAKAERTGYGDRANDSTSDEIW
jgi:hypothetical protein